MKREQEIGSTKEMIMANASKAYEIWEKHKKVIPGGVVSLNRKIDPMRVFVRAKGAYLWDIDGKKYIDYHAAFSPHLLGHNDTDVNGAVAKMLQEETSLIGAGTTLWEGELAQLVIDCVPTLEKVQITNSGSESTFHAVRISRAVTGREEIIVMQGGYNGWHNDVAFNLMDPFEKISSSKPGEELPHIPMSGGIPEFVKKLVHVVQFNDLEAVEKIMKKRTIACIITEPILQNIGVVKPKRGYLAGLRELSNLYGTLLIFDEVKTGFRSALGGYQSICRIRPDLSTFGKGIANGYPLGVIGGKGEYMDYFDHSDPTKKVMIAGTYNAHPIPVAAAIATLKKLKTREKEIYGHLDNLGQKMEEGLKAIFAKAGIEVSVSRQGSAFVVYFMNRAPENWLEIARDNDMARDAKYRRLLAEEGVFHFPTATKQGSISFAHTEKDVDKTLEITEAIVKRL
jgi:glutamate-1-semialdehyde 2,1-aminomutase